MIEQRVAEAVDPELDFAVRIIMDSDLSDLRYLIFYGEYVSANERGVAEFLYSLSQEQIDSMAETYTEGYRIGFINGRKDITKNKTCLRGGLSVSSSKFSLNTGSETAVGLPSGWDDLGSGSTLSYTMPSENILVLTYDNVSYLFKKYKNGTQSDSANTTGPLLNLTENDVWYSKEDFTTDTNRYKLSLYDNYMELHSLDEKAATENEPAFITNFFYLSSRDNEFTFYTYKDDSMNLPAVFKDLPNGFSKCTMKIHAENNSLTLSYKGQNLLFTNK